MKPTVIFTTDDKWLREPSGVLDPTDRTAINEASQGGQYEVRVLALAETLDEWQREDPLRFAEFCRQTGIPLDDLATLTLAADKRLAEFGIMAAGLSIEHARETRALRVDQHLTWRALARACYVREWLELHRWEPPSNQIVGMALAQKAATVFGEHYREPPWN